MSDLERVLARAPSNIALVKYMGKTDFTRNLPVNSSLSLTLSELCTYVEIRDVGEPRSSPEWIAEKPDGAKGEVPTLNESGREKFLRHFERCRSHSPEILRGSGLELSQTRATAMPAIRTTNTFPSEAGIASSASSFAALTLAAVAYFSASRNSFRDRYARDPEMRRSLAELSREGSGSSIRSFEGPFVAWKNARAESVESLLPPLSDLVVIVSAGKKLVGSSEAHRRVESSPYWVGRSSRAETRFEELKGALKRGAFQRVAEIAEADFRDMHHLFETAQPPFSYFAPGTEEVLEFLAIGADDGESPFAVTMDAGPNVHVVVPQSSEEFWRKKIAERFPQFLILVDRQGAGAELIE